MITANDNNLSEIYDLLYRFGLNANSCALFQMSYAIWCVMDDPEKLTLTTKLLYPEVARKYKPAARCAPRLAKRPQFAPENGEV